MLTLRSHIKCPTLKINPQILFRLQIKIIKYDHIFFFLFFYLTGTFKVNTSDQTCLGGNSSAHNGRNRFKHDPCQEENGGNDAELLGPCVELSHWTTIPHENMEKPFV